MYRFTLTSRIRTDLTRIEELREGLDHRGVLPRRWIGRLRREMEAEAVAASTSIEGVPVTVADVRRILAGDRPAQVSETDAGLVEGYRDAMTYVLRRADDQAFRWQSELLLAVHDRAMGASLAAGAGRFRTGQVYVADRKGGVIYRPPSPQLVAGEVDELCDYAQASEDPAPVLAALVHARVAGVHPFTDGNGRVSRILASLAMCRGGYRSPEFTSLEEWWGAHQAEYYAMFRCLGEGWDADADATCFVEAHVSAQCRQVEARSLKQRVEREVWTALEDIAAEEIGMPPRAADALFDAFFGHTITNRYYRSIADVSTTTAVTDLQRLEASGLVAASGAGRSRAYSGTFALIARVASLAGATVLADAGASLDAQRGHVLGAIAEQLGRS